MDSGVVLFLMRHKTTSQILPLIAAAITLELVLNLLGEDTKQANRCCFGETGNFLGICAAAGWAGDFAIRIRFAVNLFAEGGYFLFFMSVDIGNTLS